MPIHLFRVDERLLHGQVVVGWGTRFNIVFYVVVDDLLSQSAWERDLYAAGVGSGVDLCFVSTDAAVARFADLDSRAGWGALLTRGTRPMRRLAEEDLLRGRRVNLGGLYAGEGRRRALDYVFLGPSEVEDLEVIRGRVESVSARALPTSQEVGIEELLRAIE